MFQPKPASLINTVVSGTNGHKYLIQKVLGQGTGGSVYQGVNQTLNEVVAIKHQQQVSRQEQEANLKFKSCKFVNVINIIDFFPAPMNYTFIIMEYANSGSLDTYIRTFERRRVPPQETIAIMQQIAKGVKELHDMNLIHRDLKPDNIVIHNKDGETFYKICDLGLIKQQSGTTTSTRMIGTPYYMAPELLDQAGLAYTNSIDIWALGCIWYQLLKGEYLFHGTVKNMNKIQSILQDIRNTSQAQIDEQVQSLSELGVEVQHIRCIKSMINRDYLTRPNINEVISSFEIKKMTIKIMNPRPKISEDQTKLIQFQVQNKLEQEKKQIQDQIEKQEQLLNERKQQFDKEQQQRETELEIKKQEMEQEIQRKIEERFHELEVKNGKEFMRVSCVRNNQEQVKKDFERKLEEAKQLEQAKIKREYEDLIRKEELNLKQKQEQIERDLKIQYQQLEEEQELRLIQAREESGRQLQKAIDEQLELQKLALQKQKEADEFRQQSLSAQGQNKELSAMLGSLKAENTELQYENAKLNKSIKELQDKANELQQKSDQYYTSYRLKQQDYSEAMEQIIQKNQLNQELRENVRELEEQLTNRLAELDEIKIQHQIEIEKLKEHYEKKYVPQQQNNEQSIPATPQQTKWITKSRGLIQDRTISDQLVKIIKSGKNDQFSEIEGTLLEYFERVYEDNIRVLFLR